MEAPPKRKFWGQRLGEVGDIIVQQPNSSVEELASQFSIKIRLMHQN